MGRVGHTLVYPYITQRNTKPGTVFRGGFLQSLTGADTTNLVTYGNISSKFD